MYDPIEIMPNTLAFLSEMHGYDNRNSDQLPSRYPVGESGPDGRRNSSETAMTLGSEAEIGGLIGSSDIVSCIGLDKDMQQ